MANVSHEQEYWDSDEIVYSSSAQDSDESPILSHRYDRYKGYIPYHVKVEEKEKRSTVTVLAKFFLFCTTMIMFCVLMYIPVYNKVGDSAPKGYVAGWYMDTNRDTKLYVLPHNSTTLHEPKDLCSKRKNNLFLIIFVCSSTEHSQRRKFIRDTWGDYKKYIKLKSVYNHVKYKYRNYNFSYINASQDSSINPNSISSFSKLLPEIAKALKNNLISAKIDSDSPVRVDDSVLPEFDMDKAIADGENEDFNYDYYESNVMKIPPKGYEDIQDSDKVLDMLKQNKELADLAEKDYDVGNTEVDFKVVFIVGLPSVKNDSVIQKQIEYEVEKYGDIIQEDFVDSYNNLTLKSIMMLKWVTKNCDNVRYMLKTDDDMYINVPNLVWNLRNRSRSYDEKVAQGHKGREYLLIGDLICGARPVLDSTNKWYSPKYMYEGAVYPRYLSGTAYALSMHTAKALYDAALKIEYFHLEDIFITGMCAARASPRQVAEDDATFSYRVARACGACCAWARAAAHRVSPTYARALLASLADERVAESCEKQMLAEVRMKLSRPKPSPKHSHRKT